MIRRSDYRPRKAHRQFALSLEYLEMRNLLATVISVDTFADVIDENDGHTSLREAILHANATPGEYDLQLQAGTYEMTIASTFESQGFAGDLDIHNSAVRIYGAPGGGTTIDASGMNSTVTGTGDRIFDVTASASLELYSLTLANAIGSNGTDSTSPGGAVRNVGGRLRIEDCVFANNQAISGGAVYSNSDHPLTILRSEFRQNVSREDSISGGGAIRSRDAGGLTIVDCTFLDNTSASGGGAVDVGSLATILNSTFSGNVAAGQGGAIYQIGFSDSTSLTIADSTFSNNSAARGGAIGTGKSARIVDSIIQGNSAELRGGGLYLRGGGEYQILRTTVAGNTSEQGGGMYLQASNLWTERIAVFDCLIEGNDAKDGGGMFAAGVEVFNTIVRNNSAINGGGIYADGDLRLRGSTVQGNSAVMLGGGIYTAELLNSSRVTVSGNSAARGGGMYLTDSGTIENTTISGNYASFRGGGILSRATQKILHSTIVANRSDGGNRFAAGGGFATEIGGKSLFEHTIVAGNTFGPGGEISDILSDVSSASRYNLIGDPFTAGGLGYGALGNVVGNGLLEPLTLGEILDPELKDNGGPTETHALRPGSLAIDAGDPLFQAGSSEFDQRGATYSRVSGTQIDIGALESGSQFQNVVVGRHLFYNDSRFDGRNPAISFRDSDALATDKHALLPNGTLAGASNITSYSRGINGIMVDLAGSHPNITADDFSFRVGATNDPASWAEAPAPSAIQVYAGQGVGGADRVVITWPDGAIKNTYLQVIVAVGEDSGLAEPDVFFFGSRMGDTFGTQPPASFVTSAADELAARYATPIQGLDVANPYDFDKNGAITAADMLLARSNVGILPRIQIAPPAAASPLAAGETSTSPGASSVNVLRNDIADGNAVASAMRNSSATPDVLPAPKEQLHVPHRDDLQRRLVDQALPLLWSITGEPLVDSADGDSAGSDAAEDALAGLEDVLSELTHAS